ncbi:UDP-N-acetylmuramate--L-alanine ligase [Spirochaeta isovalerica]|uniref:UDP-N-acetylmuramate--L-alanine ligase n=1 Tax=Spirochaeta isovalerica TaxID=150 RepID=A0A841REP7_9SPIO|nr:UDP-N-acetylmuramate--L-alanine ligase [Spirochaeta isovalerica]MBB6480822.1 UDP-N-acetylmuramate--alanine ligase [Spirochaeta isovalerica]
MDKKTLPASLKGFRVHLVGIKGTGMAAFAELLQRRGADISGSDIDEKFYTDEVLQRLGIPYEESFRAENIDDEVQLVIHSAAYGSDNPELSEAHKRHIPVMVYTEALGYISSLTESFGVAGIHGKTTTTALAGTVAGAAGLEASVLVGSAVPSFGGFSTAHFGEKYFIAETCEYKRHFLAFHPRSIILTSIEPDHLDYFKDIDDILDAFLSYIDRLPAGGDLIYCADDEGAVKAADIMKSRRADINYIPYGTSADGPYRISSVREESGLSSFRLDRFSRDMALRIPGHHLVLDAAAAVALVVRTLEREGRGDDPSLPDKIAEGLRSFAGSRRRSEIVGEAGGILFMDDYAHHPTAINTTLEGLKKFYPGRRIVVDFMSHTYSRTAALLEEFAASFGSADLVLLEDIYASAREKFNGTITGRDLYERTAACHGNVRYFNNFEETERFCRSHLKDGDLFITMGAGNNWNIGKNLYNQFKKESLS